MNTIIHNNIKEHNDQHHLRYQRIISHHLGYNFLTLVAMVFVDSVDFQQLVICLLRWVGYWSWARWRNSLPFGSRWSTDFQCLKTSTNYLQILPSCKPFWLINEWYLWLQAIQTSPLFASFARPVIVASQLWRLAWKTGCRRSGSQCIPPGNTDFFGADHVTLTCVTHTCTPEAIPI